VICSAFDDIQASAFHLFHFKCVWKDPLDGHQEHVFDELYTSDSWLDAQDDLQRQLREPGCSLEYIIGRLMLFSILQLLERPRLGPFTYTLEI
jgi:hypothetical protein